MSFLSGAGSVVAGLINSKKKLPKVDMTPIFDTINKNKGANELLINGLDEQMKPLYEQYIASLNQGGDEYQQGITDVGQNLLDKTSALYDPNSAAVQATLAALKQQTYSTLPGTLDSLRANLAATGGLGRGGASKAITQAILAPAQQYGQQAMNVQADQLNKQQSNVQNALNTIANMDETAITNVFGMTKDQASNILQFGREDLKNQLADLISNNNAAASATMGAQGVQINNAYQNAVTRNAQQAAIVNGLAQLPAQFQDDSDKQVDRVMSIFGGGLQGGGGGFDPNTMSTPPGGSQQYRPNPTGGIQNSTAGKLIMMA